MKNPKSKVSTVKTTAVKPTEMKPGDPQFMELCKLMSKTHQHPSVFQLAQLSTQLARREDFQEDKKMCAAAKMAHNLWLTCAGLIRKDIQKDLVVVVKEVLEGKRDWDGFEYALHPRQFWETGVETPVTRDEFMRATLPQYKNRPADLARIGKAFMRNTLRERNGKEPTHDEIVEAYGSWPPYKNRFNSIKAIAGFHDWYEKYVKDVRRGAGLKSAAKKSAAKKS